ncbi:MAG TPA: hypothetical protein VMT12_05550 [Syntrophales bacterium]|nr:hypothetical protein [Syntrophales bacterium]
MKQIVFVTIKGILRDRIFLGIGFVSLLFLLIPSVSSLSMRQSTELSISLSLSLISFVLLLLSVFLGGTSLWRDIDRRYAFSILSLPIPRTMYVVGRFLGVSLIIILVTLVLGCISLGVVWTTSSFYPPEHAINWGNLSTAIVFESLRYILLSSCAFFFSALSTSFFLPVFGTITTYFAGSAMQQVYEYVNAPSATELSPFLKSAVKSLYYFVPNLSSADLSVYAIYGVNLNLKAILLTLVYFFVYTCIVITLTSIFFHKREIK